jgi:hypothetical protein
MKFNTQNYWVHVILACLRKPNEYIYMCVCLRACVRSSGADYVDKCKHIALVLFSVVGVISSSFVDIRFVFVLH